MKISPSSFALCALMIAGTSLAANAVPVDYGYPPPGGVTFSSNSGIAGNAGGVVNSYSNFDNSQYGDLYFGLNWIDMGQGTPYSVYDLTAVGAFGGATETWTGNFTIQTTYGPVNSVGTFTATLSSGTWIDPAGVGITGPGVPLAVTHVTGDYDVTATFTVGATPYNTWYLPYSTNGVQSHTDFGGDFWATAANNVSATPLPAALPLFASGLGALGLFGLRRKRRAKAVVAA